MGVCMGRTQGMKIQKGLVQVLLHDHGGFHGILSPTPLILRRLLQVLENGAAATLALHLQETLGALAFLFGQLAKEVTHAFQGHIVAVEIETLREDMATTMVSRPAGSAHPLPHGTKQARARAEAGAARWGNLGPGRPRPSPERGRCRRPSDTG